jgi:hypothetical protein
MTFYPPSPDVGCEIGRYHDRRQTPRSFAGAQPGGLDVVVTSSIPIDVRVRELPRILHIFTNVSEIRTGAVLETSRLCPWDDIAPHEVV